MDTLNLVAARAQLNDTRSLAEGAWFDVTFPSRLNEAPESHQGP
jgi:hypothetical protein